MESYIEEKRKLKNEYRNVFEKVETYAAVRCVEVETREEMLMNLVDMLCTAQEEGKPAERIVGKDIEKFCKGYFSEYNDAESRVKGFPGWLNVMCWCVLGLCLLEFIPTDQNASFHIMTAKVELGGYLCGILITILAEIVVLFLGRQMMFRLKNMNRKILYGLNVVLVLVFLGITLCIFGEKENVLQVPLFPVMLFCTVYIAGYKIVKFMIRYKTYGTIRKQKNPESETLGEVFKKTYQQTIQKELPLELTKKFHKKNQVLKRKGKREITPEEYMGILREENRQIKYGGILFLVWFVVILGVWLWGMTVEITVVEIFVIPCFLVGLLLFLWMDNKIYKIREAVLEQCGKDGITVLELAERVELDEDKHHY